MTQPEWIDISYPIKDGMLYWPQEPEPPSIITRSSTVDGEGTVTMTEMVINTITELMLILPVTLCLMV